MNNYVLAIDQGTTGTSAMIFDCTKNEIIAFDNKEFKQYYPENSWVEHDLNEIWETIKITTQNIIKKSNINPKDIKSIGITNQRETTCAFSKNGIPLEKAIVWQDKRTTSWCEENKENYKFKNKTGLPLDPYFSATKMNWFLNNSTNVKKAADNNDLCLGTIDTFLLYKLSNSKSFATEPSNASRTLLMNLESLSWDQELLSFFDLKKDFLPNIQDTFSNFGTTEGLDFLPDGIPITCLFGDQQSALFGQACINEGDIKCTYGTGGFALLNTGSEIIHSNNGLLSTVAFKFKDKSIYALEGSAFIAGAAVQFLRDNFNFIQKSKDIENLAKKSENNRTEDLFFFPFFTGIGSPYWNPSARGCIWGMTRDTQKSDISKVCLEGICLSINDLLESFELDFKKKIKSLNVDGGAVENNYLMEMQSSFSEILINRPKNIETTAFGAITGSLIGNNDLKIEDVSNFWKLDKTFHPNNEKYYFEKKKKWKNLVTKIFS